MPDLMTRLTGEVETRGQSGSAARLASPRRRVDHRPAWLQSFLDDGPLDVSVCIVNWNCREQLRDCLASLHHRPQDVTLETIVVDNASQDGATDMVAREFPETVLIRNSTNVGFARANNQAAQRARGRFLFFLNNDTVVPEGALGRLVDYAIAHPEIGMIGPRLCDAEGRYQVSYRQQPTLAALLHRTYLFRWTGLLRRYYRRYRRDDFDPHATRTVDVLMGAAMFLPRQVFLQCGQWDEDFTFGGEDMELSVRVGRQFPVVFLSDVEITHLGRVSTRQNIGYTSANVAVGFVRYLRKTGSPTWALGVYKFAVTLDAPLQLLEKCVQYLWRRLRGRRKNAEKSLLAARGLWHFLLEGLIPLWRA